MNSENQFGNLSAENNLSAFAQMTPEEHSEFQAWLDETRENAMSQPSPEPRRVQSKLP